MEVADVRQFVAQLAVDETARPYLDELKRHHPETHNHSWRTALLAVSLGQRRGLMGVDLYFLGNGAFLHDFGKCDIAEEILNKPAGLSVEERQRIMAHPRLGFLRLNGITHASIRQLVVSHHEFKKLPYPRKGNDRRASRANAKERRAYDKKAVLMRQIIAVADMYDALSSARAYKEALPKTEVYRIMCEEFTGDRSLVDSLFEMVERQVWP